MFHTKLRSVAGGVIIRMSSYTVIYPKSSPPVAQPLDSSPATSGRRHQNEPTYAPLSITLCVARSDCACAKLFEWLCGLCIIIHQCTCAVVELPHFYRSTAYFQIRCMYVQFLSLRKLYVPMYITPSWFNRVCWC